MSTRRTSLIRRAVSFAGAVALALTSATPALMAASADAAEVACARTLNVVAHQDDDLLFINPAISADLAAGRCVTTLFLTAGDAARGAAYWRSRELGAMAAYAQMTGGTTWVEDSLMVSGRPVHRATLEGTGVTLLFLRLPDRVGGWPLQTVQQLWLNPAAKVTALGSRQIYTRKAVMSVLTGVMAELEPEMIRTQDFHGTYGDGDHDDHHSAAYFTYAAQRRYAGKHGLAGYMGYGASKLPDNVSGAEYDSKVAAFMAYAPHDFHVCQAAEVCERGHYRGYFAHSVTVPIPEGPGRNVAGWAAPSASSQDVGTGQTATKVADGRFNHATIGEWVTRGGLAGSWVKLSWPEGQRLGRVVLHDRPGARDRVMAGVLTFSDGSTVPVGALPNNGAPLAVRFEARDVTSVKFTITEVSPTTTNAGLAELGAITAL
ncbi:PIG-L family deacetylase [Actinoplanes sp. NPDC051861]|uniref:DUF7402 domain-containing protein n=1 Tax=Actinoplanes sp. NPDC051861 TaxID=3155170 RepID=UPI00341D3A4D